MSTATPGAPSSDAPLRLAVISTPRSGNTWLRRLVATVFDLQEIGATTPGDLDWAGLPPRAALQIHWLPTEPFRRRLDQHGFRVLVIARHPLDVFLSALNYLYYSHNRADCRDGADCPMCALQGARPLGRAFRDFCCGPFGADVLAYTTAWWDRPGIIPVRYERLVEDTAGELERVVQACGAAVRRPVAEAVQTNSMDGLRQRYGEWRHHFWQGRPDLWKRLLTADAARAIAEANAAAFERLGYRCDPDESLTAAQAEENWQALRLQGAGVAFGPACVDEEAARRALVHSWQRLGEMADALAELRHELQALRRSRVEGPSWRAPWRLLTGRRLLPRRAHSAA
jgi:hypothetical protein